MSKVDVYSRSMKWELLFIWSHQNDHISNSNLDLHCFSLTTGECSEFISFHDSVSANLKLFFFCIPQWLWYLNLYSWLLNLCFYPRNPNFKSYNLLFDLLICTFYFLTCKLEFNLNLTYLVNLNLWMVNMKSQNMNLNLKFVDMKLGDHQVLRNFCFLINFTISKVKLNFIRHLQDIEP